MHPNYNKSTIQNAYGTFENRNSTDKDITGNDYKSFLASTKKDNLLSQLDELTQKLI